MENPHVTLVTTGEHRKIMPAELSAHLKAQIYQIDNVKSVYSMFASKRYDYAIVSVDNDQLPSFKNPIQAVKLHSVKGYHMINAKHQHLAEALSSAIKKHLSEM